MGQGIELFIARRRVGMGLRLFAWAGLVAAPCAVAHRMISPDEMGWRALVVYFAQTGLFLVLIVILIALMWALAALFDLRDALRQNNRRLWQAQTGSPDGSRPRYQFALRDLLALVLCASVLFAVLRYTMPFWTGAAGAEEADGLVLVGLATLSVLIGSSLIRQLNLVP